MKAKDRLADLRRGEQETVAAKWETQRSRSIGIRWNCVGQSIEQIGGIRHAALTGLGLDLRRKVENHVGESNETSSIHIERR